MFDIDTIAGKNVAFQVLVIYFQRRWQDRGKRGGKKKRNAAVKIMRLFETVR